MDVSVLVCVAGIVKVLECVVGNLEACLSVLLGLWVLVC